VGVSSSAKGYFRVKGRDKKPGKNEQARSTKSEKRGKDTILIGPMESCWFGLKKKLWTSSGPAYEVSSGTESLILSISEIWRIAKGVPALKGMPGGCMGGKKTFGAKLSVAYL